MPAPQDHTRRTAAPSRRLWFAVPAAVVLYVLSFGPASWLASRAPSRSLSSVFRAFYRPCISLAYHSEPYFKHFAWWHDTELSHGTFRFLTEQMEVEGE